MAEELRARFRIVTPMFLGGRDPVHITDQIIRPPSLKGALRFWWRALRWPAVRASASDDASALCALHAEEARVFGAAAKERNRRTSGGQACFLMTARPSASSRLRRSEAGNVHPSFAKVTAARYLGYGLMTAFQTREKEAGYLERDCFAEDQRFDLHLRFRAGAEPTVVSALEALGLLGGLGSRARHGMGSIALESIELNGQERFSAPADTRSYRQAVHRLFGNAPDGPNRLAEISEEPPFTAFSAHSRIDALALKPTPYEALDAFALELMRYRGWGQSSKGNKLPDGARSEKRFRDDHDWFRKRNDGWRDNHPGFHPERVVFGLPHNYGKQAQDQVKAVHFERRASPLLLHIHPIGKEFLAVTSFLPAKFLPPGEQIDAGGTPVPVAIDWAIITELLDGKVGNPPRTDAPDRFPGKQRILP